MPLLLPLDQVSHQDRILVGGKGLSLAMLAKAGFHVPPSLCISTEAYRAFVADHGLAERIQLEFNRKNFDDMRWEEIWDMALRIRNLFLTLPIPADLEKTITSAVSEYFQVAPVAIRSSAPDEDAKSSSFAGLHESFINIKGTPAILDHIKLVWASLWSDAALLYRQEIGLDTDKSTMAVVLQKVIHGRCSGILFTRSPTDEKKSVIEGVHGLNEALVEGLIEPDRWFVSRNDGKIEHMPVSRTQYMTKSDVGTELVPLPQNLQSEPPLRENEIKHLFDTGLAVEEFYNSPQDIEWTFVGDKLVILQARPISTDIANDPMDKRPWYLSLHRSLENLHDLWLKIENDLLPAMSHEADELHQVDLQNISDMQLATEIEKRMTISEKWTGVYWQDFIPFAHGMRLFGQVYNDTVRPDNPYEFVELLVHAPLQSIERNSMILDLAKKVQENDALRIQLENDSTEDFVDNGFALLLEEFVSRYGDFSCSLGLEDHCRFELKTLVAMILEMASHPLQTVQGIKSNIEFLEKNYFQGFSKEKRAEAEDILKLGRASYRLRDDDNIYLGRIELEVARALEESHKRLERSGKIPEGAQSDTHECLLALRDHTYIPSIKQRAEGATVELETPLKARQMVGQPAGPGIVQGKARVITGLVDLGQIKKGEVLICDAIEPNMTFVVPLTAAIVERRGGMLIHGAIIAREYGIPCVTGIADATRLIRTGDRVSVDGYLGIVTLMNAS